ncbi:hypothetical protein EVAR_95069_1 [Eumeta japonica]|uniref:Uncharacterized protein n=1 Tax=Eumeta variegata TaxID=151549 RepID=A0A4C1W906_EUMVA|nr:hypothetical protein EVAR_95069_1 [Eumeta japonica]
MRARLNRSARVNFDPWRAARFTVKGTIYLPGYNGRWWAPAPVTRSTMKKPICTILWKIPTNQNAQIIVANKMKTLLLMKFGRRGRCEARRPPPSRSPLRTD